MIEENHALAKEKSVLEKILDHHKLTYKEFSEKIELSDSGLRRIRTGNRAFKMSMQQMKTLQSLLKPLGLKLEDLPNDWMIEKK